MTEDKMVGMHHDSMDMSLSKLQGDDEGQGILACCSPWGRKELDTTEQLNNNTYDNRDKNTTPTKDHLMGSTFLIKITAF